MSNGVLVIDKPQDYTSHDVVARARGILKMKRIGHAGTLDPMATGVLPLFLGPSTSAIDRIPNQDKSYIATLKLGITTDTQDITGTVISEKPVKIGRKAVAAMLQNYVGEQKQIPPMYSAVKVDGKRLYDLARQGKVIERKPRDITVYSIDLIDYIRPLNEYTFVISCSKGTYVRTLCNDIGDALGTGGTLSKLRRIVSNGLSLIDAITLEEMEMLVANDSLEKAMVPLDSLFESYAKITLNRENAAHFLNGVPLWLAPIGLKGQNDWIRLYGPDNLFLGIAKADSEKGQITQQKPFVREVTY